ncbi:sugar fermentation stimulation protein SfsA [Lachnoclostridium sp. An169]|mgnify:CR=1 FL=1|uniref:A/G-specific adenine glycosylase n=1 Tax=Lachnoclostridium sp. An169 TaxID=1965569 RepID=UPI000B377C8D|nr:A/G-specific adenine glycosylase [Lachnoclostridium sp. An169]OUP82542.1 sugar fermentation stimulation protein SfsA [Lachnoclostridium sp. An169]
MRYERIHRAFFVERPNRFIAYVDLDGKRETVHVKNTGRCAELLVPGAAVYIQESDNPARKTRWDLIAVEKGERMINMDSQIPNRVAEEWVRESGYFGKPSLVKPETTYRNSRFDLYVESEGRRIFIEVKGVTLEEDGVCRFPDAPSERAVKHLEELIKAKKEGYETYVFFVIQMKGVRYFTPNTDTHPAFAEALKRAAAAGVRILAYDCDVTPDSICIKDPVDVVLLSPRLKEAVNPLIEWYRTNRRDLPWRKRMNAYRVWISEIMLQQTRVEAVKPYYERFLAELPDIKALAEVPEDRLLKLWEGLGYYSRARNLKKAAEQIMEEYGGKFPETYEEICTLKGIGSYTAGAISSFVYGIPKPAVDGNVLRVVTRLLAYSGDIMKASVKKEIEKMVEEVIPRDAAGDFNQSLIELGAVVCLPNGEPKCEICPVRGICRAKEEGTQREYPVKQKAKARRIEERTVFVFCDSNSVAIRKRGNSGLLAGMYEFPNVEGHLKRSEVIEYGKSLGLAPVRVKKLSDAKHIFSHIEWHMTGYQILVDELEKIDTGDVIFAGRDELKEKYPMPSAFEHFKEAAGM